MALTSVGVYPVLKEAFSGLGGPTLFPASPPCAPDPSLPCCA